MPGGWREILSERGENDRRLLAGSGGRPLLLPSEIEQDLRREGLCTHEELSHRLFCGKAAVPAPRAGRGARSTSGQVEAVEAGLCFFVHLIGPSGNSYSMKRRQVGGPFRGSLTPGEVSVVDTLCQAEVCENKNCGE